MKQTFYKPINNGLIFLSKEQSKDLHFGFDTLFPTILIFDCLNEIKNDKCRLIKEKIKNVLLGEKNQFWSFNYWKKESPKNKIEPYPDDLDDTCCALSAIFRFNKNLINGEALASIVNLLVLTEKKEGGPYRTWIVPKEKSKNWDDVDVAVNSNIGYFLKLQNITLKNLKNLVEEKIIKNEIRSPFYKGELPVIYFIARFYKGKLKQKLKQKLLERAKNCKSSLDLALITTSLIRLGFKKEIKKEWVDFLVKDQQKDGSWKSDDFYFYIDKTKKTNFIGSKSISTAFVLEALKLQEDWASKKNESSRETNEYKKKVLKKIKKRFENYPKELKNNIISTIENTIKADKNGIITATPLLTFYSLNKKNRDKFSKEMIYDLGQINVLGWCAYTIYDGIVDGDGLTSELSIANMLTREMDYLFKNLEIDKETGFFDFYKDLMQKMEIRGWYELENLRWNNKYKFLDNEFDLEKLADKSIGHALTSIAIWCFLKYRVEDEEVKTLFNYFKNFIIAKQMNDDVHDWLKDLEKGEINSANYQLIKFLKDNGKNIKKEIKNKKNLRLIFWQNIVPNYCQKIIDYSLKAEAAIISSKLAVKKDFLLKLNYKNIESSQSALEERDKTLEFIKTYYK